MSLQSYVIQKPTDDNFPYDVAEILLQANRHKIAETFTQLYSDLTRGRMVVASVAVERLLTEKHDKTEWSDHDIQQLIRGSNISFFNTIRVNPYVTTVVRTTEFMNTSLRDFPKDVPVEVRRVIGNGAVFNGDIVDLPKLFRVHRFDLVELHLVCMMVEGHHLPLTMRLEYHFRRTDETGIAHDVLWYYAKIMANAAGVPLHVYKPTGNGAGGVVLEPREPSGNATSAAASIVVGAGGVPGGTSL